MFCIFYPFHQALLRARFTHNRAIYETMNHNDDQSVSLLFSSGTMTLWNPDEPTTPRGSVSGGPLSLHLELRLQEACDDLGLPADGPAGLADLLGLEVSPLSLNDWLFIAGHLVYRPLKNGRDSEAPVPSVALIIVDYFNGTANPKTQSKLDGKSVVQNPTQLLHLCHLVCYVRSLKRKHVTSHRHLYDGVLGPNMKKKKKFFAVR